MKKYVDGPVRPANEGKQPILPSQKPWSEKRNLSNDSMEGYQNKLSTAGFKAPDSAGDKNIKRVHADSAERTYKPSEKPW